MPKINKPYTFASQTTASSSQVNQDLDTLYNLVNGGLDQDNLKAGGVATTNLADNAVTPSKTEGVPYAQDILSAGYSGLTVTKDGTQLNQVNVASGIVYIQQADGTLKRYAPSATNFRVATANNTYYLDFQPDGTWWWNTGHTQQANYINVATVTSDASSNVNVVTQNSQPFGVSGGNTNVLTNAYYRLHR